jgi:hypothetical protein
MAISPNRIRCRSRAGLCATLVAAAGCGGFRTPLDDAAWRADTTDADVCAVSTTLRTVHPVPDVLIVLDRSSSMNWSLTADSSCRTGATGCSSRLATVTAALRALVRSNASFHWGLELFSTPNTSSCAVSTAPQVDVGANKASAIEAVLASLTTEQSTPTTAALNVATAYLKKIGDGNSKAILLATDGLPTCASSSQNGDDLLAAESAAAAAKKAGFPVYVIGLGLDVDNLNGLATAGGTHAYYPVTSSAALDDALSSIARVVSLCTFKADKVPSDEGLVYVYVDKERVEPDPDNGWSFDASDATHSTITLNGRSCEDVLASASSTVEIVQYQCPDNVPVDAGP